LLSENETTGHSSRSSRTSPRSSSGR
jgi:hypothetical protein